MVKENLLLPEVKNEIINAVLYFCNENTIENQLESLHTWLIDYLDMTDGDAIKDNLNVYMNMRSLLKNLKAIEEKYKISL